MYLLFKAILSRNEALTNLPYLWGYISERSGAWSGIESVRPYLSKCPAEFD